MYPREEMFDMLYQDALDFYKEEMGSNMSKSMASLMSEGLSYACLDLYREQWSRNHVTCRAAHIAYFWIKSAKEKSKVGPKSLSSTLRLFLNREGAFISRNPKVQRLLNEIITLDLSKGAGWDKTCIRIFLDVQDFLESYIATQYIESQSLTIKSQDLTDTKQLLNLINQLRENRVLILGKYPDDGIQRIRLIEQELNEKRLSPIVFRDLIGISNVVEQKRITEEVNTVANLCRFVIVEDSEPSGHLIELTYLSVNMITTAILREEGMGSTILTDSFLEKNAKFIKEFSYLETNLSSVLDDVIAWAKSV